MSLRAVNHVLSMFDTRANLKEDHQVPGYELLELVLTAAYTQAAHGKGAERHAMGDDFTDQPIIAIGQLLKSADGELYQAIKKSREGLMMHRNGNTGAAIREFLGAINYIAAAALLVAEDHAMQVEAQNRDREAEEAYPPLTEDEVLTAVRNTIMPALGEAPITLLNPDPRFINPKAEVKPTLEGKSSWPDHIQGVIGKDNIATERGVWGGLRFKRKRNVVTGDVTESDPED